MEVLESLFSKALKLESPWEITKVEFLEDVGRMNPPHSRAVGYHVGFADNMKGLFEHSSHP